MASRLTGTRNETTLTRSDQRARNVESDFLVHESLCPRNQRLHHHEQREDLLEAISLDQKLDWELSSQETEELHRGSVVVVILVHS